MPPQVQRDALRITKCDNGHVCVTSAAKLLDATQLSSVSIGLQREIRERIIIACTVSPHSINTLEHDIQITCPCAHASSPDAAAAAPPTPDRTTPRLSPPSRLAGEAQQRHISAFSSAGALRLPIPSPPHPPPRLLCSSVQGRRQQGTPSCDRNDPGDGPLLLLRPRVNVKGRGGRKVGVWRRAREGGRRGGARRNQLTGLSTVPQQKC